MMIRSTFILPLPRRGALSWSLTLLSMKPPKAKGRCGGSSSGGGSSSWDGELQVRAIFPTSDSRHFPCSQRQCHPLFSRSSTKIVLPISSSLSSLSSSSSSSSSLNHNSSDHNMIHRPFHSTTTSLAPKKRRASASSARRKKQRDLVKEQQAKQRKKVIISKGGNENMKQRQRQPQHHDRRTTQHPQRIPDPIQKQPRNIDRKEIPRAFLTQTA